MTRLDDLYCNMLDQVSESMGYDFMFLLDEVVGERMATAINRTANRAIARLQVVDEHGDCIGTPRTVPMWGSRPTAPPV